MAKPQQSSSPHLRVALAQLNYKIGDLAGNFAKISDAVERARTEHADLVVFSELALCGYPPLDLVHRTGFVNEQLRYLERVAALSDERLGIVVGFVDYATDASGKKLFNAAALCRGGTVVDKSHKGLLPTYDVFNEDRYFEPAPDVRVHRDAALNLGISICEDAWNSPNSWEMPRYRRDPIAEQVLEGAHLLINISASPFSLNKADFRHDLLAAHATTHKRWFVFVNQVGGNDELIFDGRSFILTPDGAMACRLAEFDEDFAVVDIPLDAHGRPTTDVSTANFNPALIRPIATSEAEQARRALVLGVRDYVQKSGFPPGAIIGLSGGVDSALTTAIAAEAFGAENVLTVGMPSRYSSDHSVTDARQLAENLGARFELSNIEPQFAAFLEQLAPLFGDRQEDVTEENLQARIRGMFLMALSNKFGKLVLAAGNKSELAVGYCTLYGDMCGALSVIGDVPKTLVYEICHHINDLHGRDVIPQNILVKAPSAELRPGQVDQDSLPPYDILDAILEAYIEERLEPQAIIDHGHDSQVVHRIIAMLHRAEYKRTQSAPVLKITSKAFGQGWQYPLAASYRWSSNHCCKE